MNHIYIYPETNPDTGKVGLRVKVPVARLDNYTHRVEGWLAADGTIGDAAQFDSEEEATAKASELRAELTDATKPTVDTNHFIVGNEAVLFERGPLTEGETVPEPKQEQEEEHADHEKKHRRKRGKDGLE